MVNDPEFDFDEVDDARNWDVLAAIREDGGFALRVGMGAIEANKQLGPVAWSVLETLVLLAVEEADGQLATTISAKVLGGVLGMGKDRTNNAMRRLRDTGWITLRHAPDGRKFERSVYILNRIEVLAHPSRSSENRPFGSADARALDDRGQLGDGIAIESIEKPQRRFRRRFGRKSQP